MSFASFNAQPLRTREQIAQQVHTVSLARGLDSFATVLTIMAIADEAGANGEYWCPCNPANFESLNYPHDSTSNDGGSVGYLQQQKGPNGELWWGSTESMMTLSTAVDTFLSKLAGNYGDARNDPVMAGEFIQTVQDSYDPSGSNYAAKWHEAHELVASAIGDMPVVAPPPVSEEPPVADDKPSYNEFPIWSPSWQDRAGTKVDLFLIHTQEGGAGDSAAENLANYLANPANQVSYHYTISQASDGGVTLVDCVDTDDAAWAVGDANDRSINLCFAGSSVAWTREQWLEQSSAIDVAAYIAVQDCTKYGISLDIVPPPYTAGTPGISDHMYVTDVLKWGTHTDVGPNFPWDVFAAAVAKYAALVEPPPVVTPPPVTPPPTDPEQAFLDFMNSASQMDLLKFIAAQLGPGDPSWVAKGITLRDKVWGLS